MLNIRKYERHVYMYVQQLMGWIWGNCVIRYITLFICMLSTQNKNNLL